MPSRMLLEGACRSACLSDPVTVPTHDIAADGGLGWRQLIKRRDQGVRRCPKGQVSFVTSVMAAGAVRRVWEEVVCGLARTETSSGDCRLGAVDGRLSLR